MGYQWPSNEYFCSFQFLLKIVFSSKGYNAGYYTDDSLAENVDKGQSLAYYTHFGHSILDVLTKVNQPE